MKKKYRYILLNVLLVISFTLTLVEGSAPLWLTLLSIAMWLLCYNFFYWANNKKTTNA